MIHWLLMRRYNFLDGIAIMVATAVGDAHFWTAAIGLFVWLFVSFCLERVVGVA